MVRAILTCVASLLAAVTVAEPWVITERPIKSVWVITDLPQQAVVLTSWSRCTEGYCFKFSNGVVVNETFAAYAKRTGKLPAETRQQCSSGYCGTFSRRPTVATGGCACGCNAATCSCHHSPNANKPLSKQTYQPGRLVGLNNHVQWR
jgi:hypothetical protein